MKITILICGLQEVASFAGVRVPGNTERYQILGQRERLEVIERRSKEEDFVIETSQSLAHASGSLCHRVQSLECCALVSLRQI